MSTHERRRFPRYDVGRLPGVLDGFRLFDTLKLSAGGALIRLPAELTLGQRVTVSLELGDGIFRSAAHVVFVGPDFGKAGVYRVGLAFSETAAEESAELKQFIERTLAAGEAG
jgi:Tfp pilus assembly protein PilZ